MAIIGVEQNYYQNSVATTKSTKNVNSREMFRLRKESREQELKGAEVGE